MARGKIRQSEKVVRSHCNVSQMPGRIEMSITSYDKRLSGKP